MPPRVQRFLSVRFCDLFLWNLFICKLAKTTYLRKKKKGDGTLALLANNQTNEDNNTNQIRNSPKSASEKDSSANAVPETSQETVSDPPEKQLSSLKRELESEKKKNQELSKRLLYLQADYANLQRLAERRIADAKDETKLRFIEEMVSLKEDLERAMSIVKGSDSALFDGLRMLLARIEGSLRSEEVEQIKASAGTLFDPRLHEAVAYSEGDSMAEGTILSVVSNGYTMRGKVIKPVLVEVARQTKGITEHDQARREDVTNQPSPSSVDVPQEEAKRAEQRQDSTTTRAQNLEDAPLQSKDKFQ